MVFVRTAQEPPTSRTAPPAPARPAPAPPPAPPTVFVRTTRESPTSRTALAAPARLALAARRPRRWLSSERRRNQPTGSPLPQPSDQRQARHRLRRSHSSERRRNRSAGSPLPQPPPLMAFVRTVQESPISRAATAAPARPSPAPSPGPPTAFVRTAQEPPVDRGRSPPSRFPPQQPPVGTTAPRAGRAPSETCGRPPGRRGRADQPFRLRPVSSGSSSVGSSQRLWTCVAATAAWPMATTTWSRPRAASPMA
jgi:hypothetical protein